MSRTTLKNIEKLAAQEAAQNKAKKKKEEILHIKAFYEIMKDCENAHDKISDVLQKDFASFKQNFGSMPYSKIAYSEFRTSFKNFMSNKSGKDLYTQFISLIYGGIGEYIPKVCHEAFIPLMKDMNIGVMSDSGDDITPVTIPVYQKYYDELKAELMAGIVLTHNDLA